MSQTPLTKVDTGRRQMSERFDLHWLSTVRGNDGLSDVLREGLLARPKQTPPFLLYDRLGSILFDAICEVPEYYLTRAEAEILEVHGQEIARCIPGPLRLVELGSGSSNKTKLLLKAVLETQADLEYLPIDVSGSAVKQSSRALLNTFQNLRITGFIGGYFESLEQLAAGVVPADTGVRTVVLFLGSSIGNLDSVGARKLLSSVRRALAPGEAFLLGADLKKPEEILLPAYDDKLGVTAAFNLNLLVRINRELGGEFDLDTFAHRVRYDADPGRVEMHLESLVEQKVPIRGLDLEISFAAGETLHTESSHKYDHDQLHAFAEETGFHLEKSWFDSERRFSENLLLAK